MPSTARRSLLAHVVKVVVQFSFALFPNGLQIWMQSLYLNRRS